MAASASSSPYHQPVLLSETIDALAVRPDGVYVDLTFGGGGHSREILSRLGNTGRLVAFDQDESARRNAITDPRFTLIGENFRHLGRFLRLHGINGVTGILADLGVSSHQFDTAERGFSTGKDALLDMRMDRRTALTAADILRHYEEKQLQELLEKYGEVPNARTLARRIMEARQAFPLNTVGELRAVAGAVSKGNPERYLAQVFQALRIAVNDELGALRDMLDQAAVALAPGGRLAVITFHSLEDRIVKDFFKSGRGPGADTGEPGAAAPLRPVFKKPVLPSAEEIRKNSRARSAKLRVAEKPAERS